MLSKTKIYKIVRDYLYYDGIENVDKLVAEWDYTNTKSASGTANLLSLLVLLREDIRAENNKTNGMANIAKGMKAIIDNAKKINKTKSSLHGIIMHNKCQCACDGYRIARLNERVTVELPTINEENTLDIDKLMYNASLNQYEGSRELKLPSIAELKTYIKTTPKKKSIHGYMYNKYDFGKDLPSVDAQYMLDILTIFPDAKGYHGSGVLDTIYFIGKEGDAILLPIKSVDK